MFTVKNEGAGSERFKARVVAKGFYQISGENFVETFSPVMSFDSLRFLFSLTAIKNWTLKQLDAKNAFLNGKLDYPVYFKPPAGVAQSKTEIWKLKKALYGLKPVSYTHLTLPTKA